jgi:hypothetical protein
MEPKTTALHFSEVLFRETTRKRVTRLSKFVALATATAIEAVWVVGLIWMLTRML